MSATMVLVHDDERVIHVEDLNRLRKLTQSYLETGESPLTEVQMFLARVDALIAGDGE